MLELIVAGEQRQDALGRMLAERIAPPFILYLQGDLAAGKTTLARGLLRGLGYEGKVKSPTYTLMEAYELAGAVCYHFDLYRLADAEELLFLGLDDLLREEAIWLVEWPERGKGILPEADLTISFAHLEEERILTFSSLRENGIQIINSLQQVWGVG